MHKERENCEAGILLKNFWCKAIFRTQFALLLYLRNLMSSILSFCYRTKFCCKETFVEKMQSWYLLCSSDFFCGITLWGKETFVEKSSCGYLL